MKPKTKYSRIHARPDQSEGQSIDLYFVYACQLLNNQTFLKSLYLVVHISFTKISLYYYTLADYWIPHRHISIVMMSCLHVAQVHHRWNAQCNSVMTSDNNSLSDSFRHGVTRCVVIQIQTLLALKFGFSPGQRVPPRREAHFLVKNTDAAITGRQAPVPWSSYRCL